MAEGHEALEWPKVMSSTLSARTEGRLSNGRGSFVPPSSAEADLGGAYDAAAKLAELCGVDLMDG